MKAKPTYRLKLRIIAEASVAVAAIMLSLWLLETAVFHASLRSFIYNVLAYVLLGVFFEALILLAALRGKGKGVRGSEA